MCNTKRFTISAARLAVCAAALAAGLLAVGAGASAHLSPQDQPAEGEQRPAREVRVYPVGDLLGEAGSDPGPGAIVPPTLIGAESRLGVTLSFARAVQGGGGGGMAAQDRNLGADPLAGGPAAGAAAADEPLTSPLELMQLIMSTVTTEDWVDMGGTGANIDLFRDRLIISAPADTHRQVGELLAALRSQPVVHVEALWVALSAEQVAQLAPPEGEDATAPPLPRIRSEQLASLAGSDNIVARGRVSGFDGRRMLLASGPMRNVVINQTPVVATNAVGSQQEMHLVQSGCWLALKVILAGDGREALVEARTVLSRFEDQAAAVQRDQRDQPDTLPMLVYRVDTATRLPLGELVLLGGITPDASPMVQLAGPQEPGGDAERRPAADRQLYLLLRVTAEPAR